MTLEVSQASDDAVALKGDLTMHEASELHEKLRPLLDVDGVVSIDLSQAEEVDLAGLQVLVALVRHRGRDRVVFSGNSEELDRRVRLAGLSDWIGG